MARLVILKQNMDLYSEIFHSGEVVRLFSEKNTLTQMLRTEAALAKAQAANNLFPKHHADTISRCCKVELLDIKKLKADIRLGGNAAIPMVKQLTEIVQKRDPEAAAFVHLGATSQDIVDTATVLQIRDFLAWLDEKLGFLDQTLLELTQRHAQIPMLGRTLMQQALPITFGQKTGGWLDALRRSRVRLSACKKHVLKIQLGGAVGSGNEFVNEQVRLDSSKKLGLKAAAPWHTQRDTIAELAAILGILAGSLGKIARDVTLLMQNEIGEVSEGAAPGRGASSSMAHKRNPVLCAAILANAIRTPHLVASIFSAMPQENERSAGLWHSEWEPLAELAGLVGGALERAAELLAGLEVNEERMRKNLQHFLSNEL